MTNKTQYTFTNKNSVEILCVIDTEHIVYTGCQEFNKKYPDSIVTDKFYIDHLIDSKVDSENNYYDWYEIKNHCRWIDTTPILKKQQADTDALMVDQEYRLAIMEVAMT